MDFPSFQRRLRRGTAYKAWLLSALLLAGSFWATLHAMSPTLTWLQARSHVAVDGTLLAVGFHKVSEGRRSPSHLTVEYSYAFNGGDYTGNTVGITPGTSTIGGNTARETKAKLQATLTGDKQVSVWVDPVQPHVSRLDRTLDWAMSLGFASLAFFMMMYGLVIGTHHGTIPQGAVSHAQPRPWRALAFLAVVSSMSVWPLLLIILCDLPSSKSWLVFALLSAAVCVALAIAAVSEFKSAQRIGAPYIQHFQQGPATITLRFHFPDGCGLAEYAGAVGVEVRQIQQAVKTSQFSNSARISWRTVAAQQVLARGTPFLDVSADLPEWPVSSDDYEPAYWEVVLDALGTETHFWLKPYLLAAI